MDTLIIESELRDRPETATNHQNMVQMWFRGPQIWNDFLTRKAEKEYCTKSELLRHAFKFTYGNELEEFRESQILQAEGDCNSRPSAKSEVALDRSIPQGSNRGFVWYLTDEDPWIESIITFVANKRSPETRRVYRNALSQFLTFTGKHPREIRQSDVIRYRRHLESLKRSPSTISQHLACVSGYYNFCAQRQLSTYNPVKGVERPSVQTYTNATWLSKEQARLLLSQPNRNTVKGKRDYTILLILILTGLRRAELSGIERGDITERAEKIYLRYTCKGGTEIVRDIPTRCWEAIEDYIIASGRELTDSSPIFVAVTDAGERLRRYYGKNGQNGNKAITPEAIRQIVVCYARKAFGEEIRVTPHTLRHTAGTLLRRSGRRLEEVQSFLKHKRLETTKKYLHVVDASDSEFGESIAEMLGI